MSKPRWGLTAERRLWFTSLMTVNARDSKRLARWTSQASVTDGRVRRRDGPREVAWSDSYIIIPKVHAKTNSFQRRKAGRLIKGEPDGLEQAWPGIPATLRIPVHLSVAIQLRSKATKWNQALVICFGHSCSESPLANPVWGGAAWLLVSFFPQLQQLLGTRLQTKH